MSLTDVNLQVTLPLLVLTGWACGLLLVDLWIPKDRKIITAGLAVLGMVVTTVILVLNRNLHGVAFSGMVKVDGFSYVVSLICLITGILAVVLSYPYLQRNNEQRSEFYSLLLFSLVGMLVMPLANDLVVVFVAIEMLSIPLYVLSGYFRARSDSEESALKYFLLGAFSSAFLVYGMALIYGALASTNFVAIQASLAQGGYDPVLLAAGVGLLLVGLSFKVAAVPFHMWTPDVYEGAPSVVTAYMSVAVKTAGFAALVRVFFGAFAAVADTWTPVIAVISAATMILGNVSAISQTSLKRMLAYSSIAHAGYMLMAVVAAGSAGANFAAAAVVLYALSYAFTNLGTWSVLMAVEKQMGVGNNIRDLAGLAKQNLPIAIAMTVFMFSLTGMPLTLGFIGKFYVFSATMQAGYVWLAIVGVVTSLISAFYYLRVIVMMWMEKGAPALNREWGLQAVLAVAAVGTLIFGIVPMPLVELAESAVRGIFAN